MMLQRCHVAVLADHTLHVCCLGQHDHHHDCTSYSKSELMDSQCKTAAGTLEYVAPETLLNTCTYDGKAVGALYYAFEAVVLLSSQTTRLLSSVVTATTHHHVPPPSSDVWSCGIVLFVMLQGHYPFHRRPGDALAFQRMLRGELSFKVPISSACEELLRGMLVVDTTARMSMEEVRCAVNDRTLC